MLVGLCAGDHEGKHRVSRGLRLGRGGRGLLLVDGGLGDELDDLLRGVRQRLLEGGRRRVHDEVRGRGPLLHLVDVLGARVLLGAAVRVGHGLLLAALGDVWPCEIEVVAEHLVHREDALEERVGLGAMDVLGEVGERAVGGEVVGRGGQRGLERERDVRHLHVRRKVGGRLHDAVVGVGIVVHGGLGGRGRGLVVERHRVFCVLCSGPRGARTNSVGQNVSRPKLVLPQNERG